MPFYFQFGTIHIHSSFIPMLFYHFSIVLIAWAISHLSSSVQQLPLYPSSHILSCFAFLFDHRKTEAFGIRFNKHAMIPLIHSNNSLSTISISIH